MNKKGFTLIELLVAVAIILLIAVLAAVAVRSARAKQRDATRLSNISQTQAALENYFNENNSYPAGANLPLGDERRSACLSTTGFLPDCSAERQVLLRVVPGTFAKGLDALVQCGTPPGDAFCYHQAEDGRRYGIEFELENALPRVNLVQGINCATPLGISAGRCE